MAIYAFVFLFIVIHILNIFLKDINIDQEELFKLRSFYDKYANIVENYDVSLKKETKIIKMQPKAREKSSLLEPPQRELFLTEYEYLNHLNAYMLEKNGTLKEDIYLYKRFKKAS